ncbi:GumC family protein [Mesorhizobium sp. B1-1-8]|uniref:GumC family protein n=1 Tax=Mesorhizobium sp. B1-1-8 TaxID=2589976 RepID=UPI00112692B1|nr:GumC family protein [Mesorhizobium sp. B1-1-8]UCI07273.1 succinoglycan biosynthesis protein exop [Mesorhizobium sp. B1-1-8]
MVDRENREDWRRERSLLALGEAVRGEDSADASLVSIGDKADPSWRQDAAARHRAARAGRESPSKLRSENAAAPSQYQAEPVSDPMQAEYDWVARDAQPEPPEQGLSANRNTEAAVEPRYARRPLGGDDQDAQEWKPLIDPMQVIRGITRSRALILSTTILGAALGIAIALSTPKKYEATTDVIIDPRDLKLTDRDLTQNVVASDATLAIVENQVRILTSGMVLNKVVDDLNLTNDPEFNGQGEAGIGLMPMLRSILSRQDAQGPADEARRRGLTVGNLAEKLDVERGGKTFVVSVTATTQEPKKSALIANTMVSAFQQISSDIQSKTAGRATDELTGRLSELRKGVETAERAVEDFRATHDLVDAQGHLISDDQMLKLNEQLSVARARTLELNARAASARSLDVNSILNGTLPEEIGSNTMSELRSQYAALKQEADSAAIKFGPRHPQLQALNAQLAGARERIGAELQRIASSLQVDLKRSVQLEQDLASRLAQAKVQSGDVNNNLVSLRELEREAAAKRSVYEQYLLRAKETGEQKDINTANVSVISPAYPPLEAKGPSRAVMVLAGLLLGLFAGIGLGGLRGAYASLREAANARSRREAEERVPASRQGTQERVPAAEDRTYRTAPPIAAPSFTQPSALPPAPPSAPPPAGDAGRPGLFGSLTSALRNLMPARAEKPAAADPVLPGGAAVPEVRQAQPVAQPRQAIELAPAPAYPEEQQPDDASSYWYSGPAAPYAGQRFESPEPDPAAAPGDQQSQIDEIRAGLHEFREAVRELTENRSRRRYF